MWASNGFGSLVGQLVPMLAFPLFGGLLASRRPSNPIGWICLAVGAFWFLTMFDFIGSLYGLHIPKIVGVVGSWVPAVGLLGTFLLLLFPDGHLPSRRWLPVAWLSGLAIAAVTALFALSPGAPGEDPGPFALHGQAGKTVQQLGILFVLLPASMLASIVSLFVRYRSASSRDRQALKWIAFAGIAFGLKYGSTLVLSVLFDHPPTPAWLQVYQTVVPSYIFVPIAAWFAILRYGLFDIDRIISRTFSYAIITAVLVGGYATVALVPTAIIGSNHVPTGLVAAATLVVAALFRPVRRRVQNLVDHRFNRKRYDAEHTIEAFTSHLRNEVDIDTMGAELQDVVGRTMQPAHISLWLRG